MIEEQIQNYLARTVEKPVWMEMPENMPKSFVLIEKTAGGDENHILSATFAIQSYGQTKHEAAVLNEAVKKAMEAMPDTENVFSVKLNSDYDYTDTALKRYRYQAVFDIKY